MLQLRKATPITLRSAGFNEQWLQDRIEEDPSLLGLGDLHLIQRERVQASGGRIDFLMSDPDSETRYEIEIMLGSVDESHIIRTIEYWDIERQRYPMLDHRAVIVAEEITSRFSNVIRLLNRAVPILAIQLSAFRFDDSIVLQFVKVLDVMDFGDPEDEEVVEKADRAYWITKTNPAAMSVVDACLEILSEEAGEPRITYNRSHIAVGTTGYNFCWLHPRRQAAHCNVALRVRSERRTTFIDTLEEAGFDASIVRGKNIKIKLTLDQLKMHKSLVSDLLQTAERESR